ncbi:MAG: DUF6516 family protein [Burkholderiales bacterium]|nr:DUF6516 family protein [Burkholderiales bacterium]
MKATLLLRNRVVFAEDAFAELVLWKLPVALPGSQHVYKYRLAYVVGGECVVRFDNESGKGDHLHVGGRESRYRFTSVERLLADFQSRIERWNHENRDP